MKHTTIPVLLALCVIPAVAVADGFQPKPDLGVAVGIVQEEGSLYVLVLSPENGGTITAWNATDGVTPMGENPFSVDDAEWGPKLGYAHFELDGVRHAAVAVVKWLPEIIRAVDVVPNMEKNTRAVAYNIAVQGDDDGLLVTQVRWGPDIDCPPLFGPGICEPMPCWSDCSPERTPLSGPNGTWFNWQDLKRITTAYQFHDTDEPPVETAIPSRGTSFSYAAHDATLVVVEIDERHYAVVNPVDGLPVIVNALEAATIGLGDITSVTPADRMWWDLVRPDHRARMQVVATDPAAEISVLDGGSGTAYATVTVGNATTIYDITDPLDPRKVVLAGNATPPGAIQVATGLGVAHATLVHPERASLDIPDRFRLGDAITRIGPEGTWAVVAIPGGGIVLAETHPNMEISVVRDGGRVLAVEYDGGWEEVYGGLTRNEETRQYEHRVATFGDPGVRAYDITDPALPKHVRPDSLPPHILGEPNESGNVAAGGGTAGFSPSGDGWGEPGRTLTAEIGGSTWALIPVREPLADGPIMEVSSLSTGVDVSHKSVGAFITVRNIHHESLTISVDRLKIGNLVLEQHHSYSGLAASDFGDIRLRGPTTYGFVGPTETYGKTRGLTITNEYGNQDPVSPVYVVYAVPELDVVFAFVRAGPTTLAPGESKTIGVVMIDPCENDEKRNIPIDGGCGPWDYNLDPRELAGPRAGYRITTDPAEITLVAEGYPEWTVTVSQEKCSAVWQASSGGCYME